ncbi:MAG: hypothetical protein MI757_17450 [Pirellulales bacterium]|nr:hypothetical protein [Pirellulales bacterium]
MAKLRIGLVTLAAVFVLSYAVSQASYFVQGNTIKQVMRKAHKQGLLKQVLSGRSSDAERRELLNLYRDLARNTPPRGEPRSWRARTSSIVNAASAVAENDPRGIATLKNAVNCASCHRAHKD